MSYSQEALDQLESGQLEAFKKAFASALRHDDDDTLYSLAEELFALGFLNQSKRIYEQLLTKYPKEDDLRVNLAELLIDEDQTDEALNYLNQVARDSSAYVRALMVMADLYQTQELFEVSEQKLLTAHQQAPEEPAITFALAELYFTMGTYAKAVPLYLDLIKQGLPRFTSVNLVERIGLAYANAGKFEQAIGYLKQVHQADMTPDVKFETGFTYLQLGEIKLAIQFLEDLKETDPQYTSLYPYLGQAYENENRLTDALRVLQEGLGVDQYNERLWVAAADIAVKLAEEGLAEEYLVKGNELNDEDLEIVLKLSNLYLKQGRDAENIAFLMNYVKQDQIDPQFYWNLAVAFERQEDFQKAQEYYEAASPYFQNDANFLKTTFYFFREQGQRDQAMNALTRYLELVPDDGEMVQEFENMTFDDD